MTALYQLNTIGVTRTSDHLEIPNDSTNRDWQAYQTWLGLGNTPDPVPSPTLAQQAASELATKLAAGIVITGSISATFALDSTTTAEISSVANDSASGLGLPGGLSTFTYPDIHGAPVSLTAAQVQALYKAMRDCVWGLTTQAAVMKAGGSPSWPAQSGVV